MRRIALLVAALLLTTVAFAAKPRLKPISPYQYGHRWYFSLQAGPMVSVGEYSSSFAQNGHGWDIFSWHGALSIGYNFNDAWDLRISGSYSYNPGALNPYGGFSPYHFQAAHLFFDAIVSPNGLAEYYKSFNPKFYLGLGAAYTHQFTEVNHPFQTLTSPNIVPGVRVGGIAEFDGKSGFGWFIDLGVEGFWDTYNGQEPEGFILDLEFKLSLGIIYHFPLPKR